MDRAGRAMGASCAMCAIRRAIGAARASGAGGRVSRNEQVVGSIPTDGSLPCRSVTVTDLNFDGPSISVERFAERVVWPGRPDERVSWLRSVIAGRVSVPLAHGDPTRSRQPAACRGRTSRPRQPGSSVRSASCAFPALPVQRDTVPSGSACRRVTRRILRAPAYSHGGHPPPAGLVRCAPALCTCLRRDGRRRGLLMGRAASPDGVTECCDELNTYAQVRLDLYPRR